MNLLPFLPKLRQLLQRRWVASWLVFSLVLALPLVFFLAWPRPALASIHSYPESEQQIMYRSRLSLRDNQDQAWQTILFKRLKAGQVIDFQLRLISFPGQATLQHPLPLQITQGSNLTWELADQTLLDPQLQPVLDSLGQYDAKPFILGLEYPQTLRISIALNDQESRELMVPPYVLREWLQLKDLP
jgi:hypothetical protein